MIKMINKQINNNKNKQKNRKTIIPRPNTRAMQILRGKDINRKTKKIKAYGENGECSASFYITEINYITQISFCQAVFEKNFAFLFLDICKIYDII